MCNVCLCKSHKAQTHAETLRAVLLRHPTVRLCVDQASRKSAQVQAADILKCSQSSPIRAGLHGCKSVRKRPERTVKVCEGVDLRACRSASNPVEFI